MKVGLPLVPKLITTDGSCPSLGSMLFKQKVLMQVREREKQADSIVLKGRGFGTCEKVNLKFRCICECLRVGGIVYIGPNDKGTAYEKLGVELF